MRTIFPLIVAILTGCSSEYALRRDGITGPEYAENELAPGLYLIKVFMTSPSLRLQSVERTFVKRADALCRKEGYAIVNSNTDSYRSLTPPLPSPFPVVPGPRPWISYIAGHILCSSSPLTLDEAKAFLSVE